jgi:excisionase family DNA binding protein
MSNQVSSDGPVLTCSDMARILRCSRRTISRLVKRGVLRKVEGLGRLVRFHRSEVERLSHIAWHTDTNAGLEFNLSKKPYENAAE